MRDVNFSQQSGKIILDPNNRNDSQLRAQVNSLTGRKPNSLDLAPYVTLVNRKLAWKPKTPGGAVDIMKLIGAKL
jgi:hypothetical protein